MQISLILITSVKKMYFPLCLHCRATNLDSTHMIHKFLNMNPGSCICFCDIYKHPKCQHIKVIIMKYWVVCVSFISTDGKIWTHICTKTTYNRHSFSKCLTVHRLLHFFFSFLFQFWMCWALVAASEIFGRGTWVQIPGTWDPSPPIRESYLILSPLQGKDIIIWLTFFFFLRNNSLEHKLNSNHFIHVPSTVKQSYLNMWTKAFKF